MQLSETIKLYPTKQQIDLINATMRTYVATVNAIVSSAVRGTSIAQFTSKDVSAELPSALINQCIRDAKSIVKKHYKDCHKTILKNRSLVKKGLEAKTKAPHLPVVKKPCCYINNQNFKISNTDIQFPVMVNGKSQRLSVATLMSDNQRNNLSNAKLGTMRIVKKNSFIVAQIVYEVAEQQLKTDGNIMGVDLGVKCPAVSYTTDKHIRFYGNGRENKYMRRHFDKLRHKLQKSKKIKALDRINNKEQRIMKDIDHKISRKIVNEAKTHNVKTIKLEQLTNIRSATRKSRKNNHSLHSWSFYRLAMFIEYKAKLEGISVEYVNPAYTSQKCPVCGSVHHAQDRSYTCSCSYHTHRDVLGAYNICNSTEYVGGSNTRRTA